MSRRVDVLFPCQQDVQVRASPTAIAWIPDFQHIHLPQLFSRREIRARDTVFQSLADHAALVVLSSADAARDFAARYPARSQKARVLSFATVPDDSWFPDDPGHVVSRYRLPSTFLIAANQFWMHKNHRCLFEALSIMRERGNSVHLVCTGTTTDYRNARYFDEITAFIREHKLESSVHILGLIPRVDQIQLLRCAAAVVQPSLFEGWSTVVEDVRLMGKRLFASDIPVHREQNVDGAVYFDPYNPTVLADSLENHISELRPGPDLALEATCRVAQRDRVLAFARNFMTIADEVWARSKNS